MSLGTDVANLHNLLYTPKIDYGVVSIYHKSMNE